MVVLKRHFHTQPYPIRHYIHIIEHLTLP